MDEHVRRKWRSSVSAIGKMASDLIGFLPPDDTDLQKKVLTDMAVMVRDYCESTIRASRPADARMEIMLAALADLDWHEDFENDDPHQEK